MDPSRVLTEQRLLRRSRIRHVVAVDDDPATQVRRRDRLLGPLAVASRRPHVAFDAAGDDLVDLAVSIGLVAAPEPPEESVSAAALALMVLAADGQFARMQALSSRLRELAGQFAAPRPFLAAALDALADVTEGRFDSASARLVSALGSPGAQRVTRQARTAEQLGDVLLATATREWLAGDRLGLARDVRQLAVDRGDGPLFALIDLVTTLASAVDAADLRAALDSAGIDVESELWMRYLGSTDIPTLFPAQLRAVGAGVLSNATRVVALPTSSGKTLIAELRIAAALTRSPGGRALYVAPYRLLARQVERRLQHGLRAFGLTVADLGATFDTSLDPFSAGSADDTEWVTVARESRDEAEAAGLPDVGICTPERLDGLIRLATSNRPGAAAAGALFDSLKLVVFDELQLVGRPGRGPRFELLLTRLRGRFPHVPTLGLSAASMGAEDLASWIGDPEPVTGGRRPTGTLEVLWRTDGILLQRFGRDVKRVTALPRTRNAVNDAAALAARVPLEYAPVLVVETTRPFAENVANRLLRTSVGTAATWRGTLTEAQRLSVANLAEEVAATLGRDHPLTLLLPQGIAYHHAGVPQHLLRGIERLAAARVLRYLVATTTVAEGADLPFRVAIIPHLSFQGVTGRIERDLYLNLVGRAGRANVAVEGVVIILDSDAPTLSNHVRASLWSDAQHDRIRGLLDRLTISGRSLESVGVLRDVQQQLLAWLGEGGDTFENQAATLAARTFTWATGTIRQRQREVRNLDQAFRYLEGQGLISANSPYRLTPFGTRARLAGLSVRSCVRLSSRIAGIDQGLLDGLADAVQITPGECRALARLISDAIEVLEQGLWLRRRHADEQSRTAIVIALENGQLDWPDGDELFQADVALVSGWLRGASLTDLGAIPPTFKRGMFSSADPAQRASDAAELLGRLTYPASRAMGAVRALTDNADLPSWLVPALELGVPSQTAAALIQDLGLSRDGALRLARELSPRWREARHQLDDIAQRDAQEIGLTRADAARLADRG